MTREERDTLKSAYALLKDYSQREEKETGVRLAWERIVLAQLDAIIDKEVQRAKGR